MKKDSIVGRPKQVFSKVNKSSDQKSDNKTPVVLDITTPKYGSLEALQKQSSYPMPGKNFGRSPIPISRTSKKRELGYPGLEIYGGYVHEDFESSLQGYRGIQMYEEMRRNDATVGAMLLVAEQLIHNASVIIEPSSVNPDAQESLMAADLVHTALKDMGNTWTDTLSEILTFLPFGFSVCAVWHKQRKGWKNNKWKSSRHSDNKWGWSGISLRAQTSLERWKTNEKGRPIGMYQQGPPLYETVYVPFTHAGHFRTRTEKDNPEGLSVLRSAVRSWWIKKRIEEVESMGIERDVTGVPVIVAPEGVDLWNSNDPDAAGTLSRAEQIVRNVRIDKYAGITLPYGWEFKIVSTPGQRAHNADKVISRWDQRIAVTLLADMLLIGQQNVGSFALVQGKIKLFSSALESYAARIAGVFNRDLIPRLMMMNGIAQEYWPSMRFGPVETPSLVDMAEYIKAFSDVGIPLDAAMALYLKQIANLPSKSELPSERAKLQEEMDAEGIKPPGEDNEEPNSPEEENIDPATGTERPPKDNGSDSANSTRDDDDVAESSVGGVKKGFIIRNTPIDKFSVGWDEK